MIHTYTHTYIHTSSKRKKRGGRERDGRRKEGRKKEETCPSQRDPTHASMRQQPPHHL
jgi:hypothetical protein